MSGYLAKAPYAVRPRPGVVVLIANALRPELREVHPLDGVVTVRQWLDAQGIQEFDRPTVCVVNDVPVLRADWATTEIHPGDVCSFIALPQGGGGGGGGGKNPLRIVLSLAVMVAAIYTAGAATGWFANSVIMGGAQGPLTASQMMTAKIFGGIVGGMVAAGGSMLVNAMVPAPKPGSAGFASGARSTMAAPSATYSLDGQANSARLGAPIPVQYGRHRVYPDLITANPWIEYADNEQYLYQPHCLGVGEFDVEAIQIAETSIDNFEEITYEIVPPGQAVTLFDVNVIPRSEVSGQEMKGTNEQTDDGYVGPFVLNPVDTVAHTVGVDVVMARGLYYANDSGGLSSKTITWVVEARAIDDDSLPTGDWIVLGTESKTDSTNTPIRLSMKYTLSSPGRYEVRVRRTDEKDTSSRAGHEISWVGLKAFIDGPDTFADVSLLLVKMRATNNLSQTSARQVNVIQTRKIPVWDDALQAWSEPQASRSIVWAAADVCRADYGGGWGDDRLILSELVALDAKLSARGDCFDGVFDTKTTVWDGVTKVVRCGRSVPVQQGNLIRMVRDEPQSVPTAMFGPRNIVKGSFNLSYIMPSEETADSVTVEFFNHRTWAQAEVLAKLEDSSGERAATVPIFGIVDRAHALREGMAIAADNRFRRRSVNFRTEKDGAHLTYGDLIAVTHPMPRWGAGGGELVAWDPDSGLMELSEPVTWTDGKDHYIALRTQSGRLGAELLCLPGNNDRQVRLVDAMPATFDPYLGYEAERTYFAFGVGTNWGRLCKVRLVQPRENGMQTEITAIVDDDRVYVN